MAFRRYAYRVWCTAQYQRAINAPSKRRSLYRPGDHLTDVKAGDQAVTQEWLTMLDEVNGHIALGTSPVQTMRQMKGPLGAWAVLSTHRCSNRAAMISGGRLQLSPSTERLRSPTRSLKEINVPVVLIPLSPPPIHLDGGSGGLQEVGGLSDQAK